MPASKDGTGRYRLLPPHLRPRYESRSDFRLMAQAFRNGWVNDVPEERAREWDKMLVEVLRSNRAFRYKHAVIAVVLADFQAQNKRIAAALADRAAAWKKITAMGRKALRRDLRKFSRARMLE